MDLSVTQRILKYKHSELPLMVFGRNLPTTKTNRFGKVSSTFTPYVSEYPFHLYKEQFLDSLLQLSLPTKHIRLSWLTVLVNIATLQISFNKAPGYILIVVKIVCKPPQKAIIYVTNIYNHFYSCFLSIIVVNFNSNYGTRTNSY